MKIYKNISAVIAALFLIFPAAAKATPAGESQQTFKAEVVQILQVTEKSREDGTTFKQQNVKLIPLEGKWSGKEIIYEGISDVEVNDVGYYQSGDAVYVDAFVDEAGEVSFYIVDFIRSGYLYLLFIIFAIAVLIVGRAKGLKALIGLLLSFAVIIKFILPQIINGRDPFLISLFGGLIILSLMIYLTEGVGRKSHIAILSVLISLCATLALSVLFTGLTKLSGLSQEETMFLIGAGQATINFQGLLLAGFVIGAIGVLDDIIIGQIEAVEQIRRANPGLPAKNVFNLAYKIGNTHLGAITNTLFLTYAGAALPLLLLFVVNRESGLTFSRLINTEIVSTEIVRTFVGSIGVILAMPIATFLAAFSLKSWRFTRSRQAKK